jgi:hypothetical protein
VDALLVAKGHWVRASLTVVAVKLKELPENQPRPGD